jgi:hypothetical protein
MSDKKLSIFAPDQCVWFSAPATLGTYHVGTLVMYNPTTGRVSPAAPSVVAGAAVVGFVTERQEALANDEPINYAKGFLCLSGAFDAVAPNTLTYFSGSDVPLASHVSGALVGARYMGPVTGTGDKKHVFKVGFEVSGSTF